MNCVIYTSYDKVKHHLLKVQFNYHNKQNNCCTNQFFVFQLISNTMSPLLGLLLLMYCWGYLLKEKDRFMLSWPESNCDYAMCVSGEQHSDEF